MLATFYLEDWGMPDVTRKLLLVLAGGFCGAITRYALSRPFLALAAALPGAHAGFPYDILLINLTGALLIGLLFGAFEHGAPLSPDARLALGTGFLGAYTTFSTFMVGAATMLRHGQTLEALLYLCGAMAGGVALAYAGFTLAGILLERQRAWALSASDELLVDGGWENAPDESVTDTALLRHEESLLDAEGRAR